MKERAHTRPLRMAPNDQTLHQGHTGAHDWNELCDYPPKCWPSKASPNRRMAPNHNEDLSSGPHGVVHDWAQDCDDFPECAESVEMQPKASSPETAPAHYRTDSGLMPWDVWKAFDLDPWEAALTKYILRSGKKDGEPKLKDLKKAEHYLRYLIEREESK